MTAAMHTAVRMRAVAYIRVSTDEQAERYGPDVQRQDIARYAEREGIELVGEFADLGVPGTTMTEDRPGLLAALDAAEEAQAAAIIVAAADRLARSTLTGLLIQRDIMAAGRQLLFAVGDNARQDADEDEMGDVEFGRELNYALASRDRRKLVGKLRKARTLKATQGGFARGRVPFGYRSVQRKQGGAVLEPDPNTAPTVERIFRLAAKGATPGEIARHMSGTPTPQGGKTWTRQAVTKIIRNPTYYGQVEIKTRDTPKNAAATPEPERIVVKAQHAPIISRRLWNQAQAQLNKRRRQRLEAG